MAVNGSVKLVWGDGEYEFNIAKLKQALELEDKCGCGIAEIYTRLRDNKWHVNDFREVLRLGLIGGGLSPPEATKLIIRYCDDRPYRESIQPALAIVMAAIVGVPGDTVGKKTEPVRTEEQGLPSSETMADSSDPSSTVSAQP